MCSGLLSRNPTLLYRDAVRTTGVVQALVEATRQRHLLRPYHMQDAHVLALVDRCAAAGGPWKGPISAHRAGIPLC